MKKSIITRGEKEYNKDCVFDKFDITELVINDFNIPKTNENSFIYLKEINKQKKIDPTKNGDSKQSYESKIREINKNRFKIRIDKLILTLPNSYRIKFTDLFTPIQYIGEGSYGLVISAIKNVTNEKFAIKIIKKNYKKSQESYLLEVDLLKKFEHERIVKLHEVINTNDYLILIMDLCEGGSLKDFIIERYKNNKDNFFIKDSEVSTIIKALLEGVSYLHKNNIVHRDLKPENIMFKQKNNLNSLMICDFGISGEIDNNSFEKGKCGTLIYMAPEEIQNRPYDILIDLWSIGIIMYILESGGKHPLIYKQNMYKYEFMREIKKKINWKFPDKFPLIARNFFMKLCKFEPFYRYNASKALKHPWILRSNSDIPLTLIEKYEKEDKIKEFKNLLFISIFLKNYKDMNLENSISNHIEKKFISTTNSSNDNFLSSDYKNQSHFSNYNYTSEKKEKSISPFHLKLKPFIKYITTNKDLSESLNESSPRKKEKLPSIKIIDSRNRNPKNKKVLNYNPSYFGHIKNNMSTLKNSDSLIGKNSNYYISPEKNKNIDSRPTSASHKEYFKLKVKKNKNPVKLLNKGYKSARKIFSKLPSKSVRKNYDSPKRKTNPDLLQKNSLNKASIKNKVV